MYRIADLLVQISEVGDMPERMKNYIIPTEKAADIIIDADELKPERWSMKTACLNYYMETGLTFYNKLLAFQGMMLHASAVAIDGYAYLFSGPCGIGKSTHAQLYLQKYGERAQIINDDKPALRRIGATWYAYGTPWCGKDGININRRVKLGGVCFLHRGDPKITRLSPKESVPYIFSQTQHKYDLDHETMKRLVNTVDKLAKEIPMFELFSHAEPSDAIMSYTEMSNAIREA